MRVGAKRSSLIEITQVGTLGFAPTRYREVVLTVFHVVQ
jgi:hypothetical protein